jgi:hypothetical protein
MADHTTDRFTVLIGREDFVDHILDMTDVQLDDELDELKKMLPDEELEQLEETLPQEELNNILLSFNWTLPGELMCSHSSNPYEELKRITRNNEMVSREQAVPAVEPSG